MKKTNSMLSQLLVCPFEGVRIRRWSQLNLQRKASGIEILSAPFSLIFQNILCPNIPGDKLSSKIPKYMRSTRSMYETRNLATSDRRLGI